jgi:hypothetical protein
VNDYAYNFVLVFVFGFARHSIGRFSQREISMVGVYVGVWVGDAESVGVTVDVGLVVGVAGIWVEFVPLLQAASKKHEKMASSV